MKLQKKTYAAIVVLILAVLAVASYLFFFRPQAQFVALNQAELVSRPDINLEFSYVGGPDALSLVEVPVEGEPLRGAFIMMPSSDYLLVRSDPEAETPASISIFVFTLPQLSSKNEEEMSRMDELKAWAADNPSLTGFAEAEGEPEVIEIDGVKGLRYTTQGAYMQEIQLFSYKKQVYMFVGQFEDSSENLRDEYEELMKTVVFL